jgi:hypothetical protein
VAGCPLNLSGRGTGARAAGRRGRAARQKKMGVRVTLGITWCTRVRAPWATALARATGGKCNWIWCRKEVCL